MSSYSKSSCFLAYKYKALFYSVASGWVYLIKMFGMMASTNNNDKTTIEFHFIDIEKDTIEGAKIIPNILMASIMPAAVDWICTEKDSVCRHTIKVYPIAE